MGLASEMKSLSDEMLNSFKNRVKDNEELIVNVEKKLQSFQNEQKLTAKQIHANAVELQNNLALGEKERMGKYNHLMSSIQKDIKSIEKDVKSSKSSTNVLIKDFSKARKIMSSDLDKFFAEENKSRNENEQLRMADYELFIGKISDEVSSIFNYTNEMLERYATEHQDMSNELREELSKNRNERFEYTHELLKSIQERMAEISNDNANAARKLRKDLNHSDAERLKEYNDLFNRISKEVTDLRNATSSLMDNYSKDRSQGAEHWKQMQNKIAAIRSGGQVQSLKKVEKSELKADVAVPAVKVTPVAEVKPQPVIAEPTKANEEVNLEDKILQYINNHSQGVKVSDMEEPLHETRMKIGFAAKCLLDAGKVSKVENLYYPIKKTF